MANSFTISKRRLREIVAEELQLAKSNLEEKVSIPKSMLEETINTLESVQLNEQNENLLSQLKEIIGE